MAQEEKADETKDGLRRFIGFVCIWIANLMNTFLAFAITILFLILSGFGGNGVPLAVILIIAIIFSIVVVSWIALHRIAYRNNKHR